MIKMVLSSQLLTGGHTWQLLEMYVIQDMQDQLATMCYESGKIRYNLLK
jgi:hypothetical protein